MASFERQMSINAANAAARAELALRARGFMFRICEIVGDIRLTKATNIFWDDSGLANPERIHNFSCHTPNELEVPTWLFIGGIIRPNSMFVTIGQTEANYYISQDLSDEAFQEVGLEITSPFDVRYASWKASIGDFDPADDKLAAISEEPSLKQRNDDFGALTSAIEFGLIGGEFQRIESAL